MLESIENEIWMRIDLAITLLVRISLSRTLSKSSSVFVSFVHGETHV